MRMHDVFDGEEPRNIECSFILSHETSSKARLLATITFLSLHRLSRTRKAATANGLGIRIMAMASVNLNTHSVWQDNLGHRLGPVGRTLGALSKNW